MYFRFLCKNFAILNGKYTTYQQQQQQQQQKKKKQAVNYYFISSCLPGNSQKIDKQFSAKLWFYCCCICNAVSLFLSNVIEE